MAVSRCQARIGSSQRHLGQRTVRLLPGACCVSFFFLQSTLPRGSDGFLSSNPNCLNDFNPRSLAGATIPNSGIHSRRLYFNPRSLAGATQRTTPSAPLAIHFNPRSLAGATYGWIENATLTMISIHAPSRERQYHVIFCCIPWHFNPRSLAGATIRRKKIFIQKHHFNPRSLAGATEGLRKGSSVQQHFNPRSLAGATVKLQNTTRIQEFQSTLPRGSDAEPFRAYNLIYNISIHAPSRERHYYPIIWIYITDFNPRSLAGATLCSIKRFMLKVLFQSTLPRGSDYERAARGGTRYTISIHAPSRERLLLIIRPLNNLIFQSTLPRGSDIRKATFVRFTQKFQSTLPRGSDYLS